MVSITALIIRAGLRNVARLFKADDGISRMEDASPAAIEATRKSIARITAAAAEEGQAQARPGGLPLLAPDRRRAADTIAQDPPARVVTEDAIVGTAARLGADNSEMNERGHTNVASDRGHRASMKRSPTPRSALQAPMTLTDPSQAALCQRRQRGRRQDALPDRAVTR